MHTRRVATATAAMGVLAVAAALFLDGGDPGQEVASPNVTWVDGYDLDHTPEAAVAFAGNEIVVLADVEEVLPARWNTASRDQPGSIAFIFTPVRVKVIEVLRGSPRLEGGSMIVRRLGGRVDGEEFIFSENVAPRGLEPGKRLLLFLGPQDDLGEGLDAATPNMAYVVDDGGNAQSSDGRWSLEVGAFRRLFDN